jgi:hypothetical protein
MVRFVAAWAKQSTSGNADSRWVQDAVAATTCRYCRYGFRLTIATFMLDIRREWTPNRRLPKSSALSASSQRRTSDPSAGATSQLRIEDTTKCSRRARGFAFGNSMASVAELSLQYSDYGEERAKPPLGIRVSFVLRVSSSSALLACAAAEVASNAF